jgi:hypothetical protein
MSALTMWQGLEERFRSVDGLRGVVLGNPTGDMDLPALYTVYRQFTRPLRNAPPASNLTGMNHVFLARLVIRFVDYAQSEMELITLLDAIPDSIDRDPRLGGRLAGGMAYCSDGITGLAGIGDVQYRVVDYTIKILEKRTGT